MVEKEEVEDEDDGENRKGRRRGGVERGEVGPIKTRIDKNTKSTTRKERKGEVCELSKHQHTKALGFALTPTARCFLCFKSQHRSALSCVDLIFTCTILKRKINSESKL